MGAKQQGAKQSVTAKKSASKIKLLDAQTDALLFTWDSGQIISNTGSVFLDKSGQWVAVEFTSRLGGREVPDLVVVQLGNALASSQSAAPLPTPPVPTTTVPKAPVPADPPAFTAAMKLGSKWAKRKKHSKAIAAYGEALAQIPEHPEALYRLARSQMAAKDKAKAVASLARISKSKHANAVQWRVEARFDIIFKPLRGDTDFRKAVGIERGPDDPATLYERLVAFGGQWEQEPIACEQPEVDLDLQRSAKRRFDLVIRSKCQGSTETTRLDGSWQETGDRRLGLTFPNTDSADEDLVCQLERCSDDSGEDCLRCLLDKDIEILLRVVRR
jgi:tetratricopeptide (TPR) repeat protein